MGRAQVVNVEPNILRKAVSDQVLVLVLVFAHVHHVPICGQYGNGVEVKMQSHSSGTYLLLLLYDTAQTRPQQRESDETVGRAGSW